MERFSAWSLHTLISLTVLCAIADSYPPSIRDDKEKFAIATASISLSFSFIVSVAHIFRSLRKHLVGTLAEMLLAVMPLSLWVVSAILIQNPNNGLASSIDPETGFEDIQYANLYFSGWLVLFSNMHLVASIFRDNNNYDAQISGWMLFFTSSIVLMGMSITLQDGICDALDEDDHRCIRTTFAIVVGACGAGLSLVAMLLLACGAMVVWASLLLGFVTSGASIFSTIYLTAASGPASSIGTMYFASWGCTALSSLLFIGALQDAFLGESEIEDMSPHQDDVDAPPL